MIVEYDRRSCPTIATILRNTYEAAAAKDSRFSLTFPIPTPHKRVITLAITPW